MAKRIHRRPWLFLCCMYLINGFARSHNRYLLAGTTQFWKWYSNAKTTSSGCGNQNRLVRGAHGTVLFEARRFSAYRPIVVLKRTLKKLSTFFALSKSKNRFAWKRSATKNGNECAPRAKRALLLHSKVVGFGIALPKWLVLSWRYRAVPPVSPKRINENLETNISQQWQIFLLQWRVMNVSHVTTNFNRL